MTPSCWITHDGGYSIRGREYSQESFFSYVSAEDRIAENHPLRPIKTTVNTALKDMSRMFTRLYPHMGRPSIPPEQLLRATVIQILYSVRSERMLPEQLDYNILFRWFVGISMDDPVWDHPVFSKNRERLLNTEVSAAFFTALRAQTEQAGLLSDEHFSLDGTLLEACASLKSFRPQPDSADPPGAAGRNRCSTQNRLSSGCSRLVQLMLI
jgi:transposase